VTAFYEKVVKVKADVAAVGTISVVWSAVKGVRRTFISTLDSAPHHLRLDLGTKLNSICSASFLLRANIIAFLLAQPDGSFDPRCRASIRTRVGHH
jgi:hypothetical protein